jgi:protein associated with RNAse G/E
MNLWNECDSVLLRGVFEGQPTFVQSARVVKDTPEETALLVWPGAECVASAGYIHRRHGDNSAWDRWQETLTNTLNLEKYIWHTNRFLILLEPKKFYSTIYIWEAASDEFVCYYINFQLPFRRTRLGFDTLDLDLDLVIEASYDWQWKDIDDFQRGIKSGGIKLEWVQQIEQAQEEVLARLEKRSYPLDAAWMNWRPDPIWSPPCLPEDWDAVD